MRRWWLVIGLLLSVGINVGILAAVAARRLAPRPAPEVGGPGPAMALPGDAGDALGRISLLADRLELEGEKRRKFLDLHVEFLQELIRLRAGKVEVQRALRRELTATRPDRQRVDRLLAESSRLNAGLERSTVHVVLAVRELLPAEDQQKYLQLVSRLRPAGPAGLMSERPLRPGDRPALRRGAQERFRRWRDNPQTVP